MLLEKLADAMISAVPSNELLTKLPGESFLEISSPVETMPV
jgi:hypothetical protein